MEKLFRLSIITFAFRLYFTQARIVGGRSAMNGEFPYQASVKCNGNHFCSGSVIGPSTVLTAAHCIYKKLPSDLTVGVGSIKLGAGHIYHVDYQIVHEDFDFEKKLNDIALLKLKMPIEFTLNVQPIAVAKQRIPSDINCVSMGWGYTVNPMKSNYLQRIDLKTIDTETCKQAHLKSNFPVVDTHICTVVRVGIGTCHGDTGGPLISYGQQIGIVSWNHTCDKNAPEVHTRVSPYLKWIASHDY